MTALLDVSLLIVAYAWPLTLLTVIVTAFDRRYTMKTRIPLVDTADPATEELVSRARARANRERRSRQPVDSPDVDALQALRDAWLAGCRLPEPRRTEFRKRIEHRAVQIRPAA